MQRPETIDASLVAESLNGNRQAFGKIVARYQKLICSLAYSATGSLSESEDLAQETFVAAWTRLASLREPEKLRSWLCSIARNHISDALKRRRRELSHAADLQVAAEQSTGSDPLPHEAAIKLEEQAILWRSLERIPELYREPLILFYREHQSIEAVARNLDLTEDAVKQRLSRGRKLLQEEVLGFIEGALERTNPGKTFTVSVVAVLPVLAVPAKAATVGTAAFHTTSTITKTLAMTTAQKAIAGATLAIVIGAGIYEARRASILQAQIEALQSTDSTAKAQSSSTATSQDAIESPRAAINPMASWQSVASPDYKQFIANLRSIGCPEQTIRDIITTQLDRGYRARIAPLRQPDPYWQRPDFAGAALKSSQATQLENEEREMLRGLFGVDGVKDFDALRSGNESSRDVLYGFLSPERRAQLDDLDRKYRQTRTDIGMRQRAGQMTFEQQNVAAQDLMQQEEDEIKSLLSPEELLEYKMRASPHANNILFGYAAFEPTEQEFRDIFRIEEQFGKNLLPGVQPEPANEQEYQEALKQAFGEERYAEFQKTRDKEYMAAYDVVRNFNLAKETTVALYSLTQDAYQKARSLLGDQNQSPGTQQAALRELRANTELATTRLLGENAFNQYTYHGWFGSWLDSHMPN